MMLGNYVPKMALGRMAVVGISVAVLLAIFSGCAPRRSASIPKAKRDPAALQLYYLPDVVSMKNPKGRWRMDHPRLPGEAFVFTDAKGVKVDSIKQPQEVLEKVVQNKVNKPILTAADIVPDARATSSNDRVVIAIRFDQPALMTFSNFTRAHLAGIVGIFSDGKLLAAPTINEAIPGGHAEVSGFATLEEAQRVADRINGKPGALP